MDSVPGLQRTVAGLAKLEFERVIATAADINPAAWAAFFLYLSELGWYSCTVTEHENVIREEPDRGRATQMQHLTEEVKKIAAEAAIGARRAQRRGQLWNTTHLVLGFPAAVLAAVSGATGLYSPGARVPAAILALLAASFSAGTTFLRADARQGANLRQKYGWLEVDVQARLVLAREAYMTADDLYSALSRLLELRSAVPSSAIILSSSQDIGAGR